MAFSIKKQANLNFKKNTTFKIPRTGSGAPIIWKVAIFSAGKSVLNGEYAWNGTNIQNGKPKYYEVENAENYIFWDTEQWVLWDSDFSESAYTSSDLITWAEDNAASPAPLSALSYSQTSFINSIYFGFDAQDDFLDCTVSRSSGGTSQFSNGLDILVAWNSESAKWEGTLYGIRFYWSENLFYWYNDNDTPAVISLIAGMTYSA